MYNEIETALTSELSFLIRTENIKVVDSYGGEFSPDDFGKSVVRLPAIFCHVDSMSPNLVNIKSDNQYSVKIYLAAKSSRSFSDAMRGHNDAPGVYDMFLLVRDVINNKQISPDTLNSPFRLSSEEIIGYSTKNTLCVGLASYSILLEE